ncbi:LysR substrate-binding domain-containing protein [Roseibium aggregatum]|uniref:LysR family transcriptional regulator n=1 Tax=Roseibium aggregatum TaxID=187304 RepID=A0A939EEK1_9HYPH|nr:LysR substrate-binding domain-containing protein [Roseibium aggregatum]MBN9671523.1 LysR family transcriptional regulator [Roseibium aggregatum]
MLDTRQLRYFVQIVESGSLSKASRELYIAQPALSQQIAKLEDEVGKPLLHRSSKGVSPTENGLALYHHARFMLRQLEQALSIARSDTGAVHGMVSVGLPATTVSALGLNLVRKIRQRYPSILLNVVEGMSGHISHLMRLGQLDLSVLFSSDMSSELTVEPLLVEELFVLVPKHSKLVPDDRTSITIAEAADLPLILPTGSHGLRQRIAAEFENRGLGTNVVAEIDSLSLLMNCVYDDIGATIKPMGAIMHEGARGREWRCLPVSDARFRRRNFLYALPSERLSTAAAVVASVVKETAAELVENEDCHGFEDYEVLKTVEATSVMI